MRVLSAVDIVVYLKAVPLFERLETGQLMALAVAVKEQEHRGSSIIVHDGEYDPCIYFLVSGTATIGKSGRIVAEIGAGDFFGEMGVLEDAPRSAAVTATSDLRLLRLDRADLLRVMGEIPGIGIAMCATLSGRLRELLDRINSERPEGDTA